MGPTNKAYLLTDQQPSINSSNKAPITTAPIVKTTGETAKRNLPPRSQILSSQRGTKAPRIESIPTTPVNNINSAAKVISSPSINNSSIKQQSLSPSTKPHVPTPTISKPTSTPLKKLPMAPVKGQSYTVEHMTTEEVDLHKQFTTIFMAGGMKAIDQKIQEFDNTMKGYDKTIENCDKRIAELQSEHEIREKIIKKELHEAAIARQGALDLQEDLNSNFKEILTILKSGLIELPNNWEKTELGHNSLVSMQLEITKVINLIDKFLKIQMTLSESELNKTNNIIITRAQKANDVLERVSKLKL